jgi:hypothetical protein
MEKLMNKRKFFMKQLKIFIDLFIILIVAGCTTVPKVTSKNDTLIAGRFQLIYKEAKNRSINSTLSNWNRQQWVNTKLRLGARVVDNNHLVQDEVFRTDDPTRFYWLWIVWNNMSEHQVKTYPVPEAGMPVERWIKKNIGLVSGTRLTKISVRMAATDSTEIEYPAITQTGTQITSTFILFNYKSPDGQKTDSILMAW